MEQRILSSHCRNCALFTWDVTCRKTQRYEWDVGTRPCLLSSSVVRTVYYHASQAATHSRLAFFLDAANDVYASLQIYLTLKRRGGPEINLDEIAIAPPGKPRALQSPSPSGAPFLPHLPTCSTLLPRAKSSTSKATKPASQKALTTRQVEAWRHWSSPTAPSLDSISRTMSELRPIKSTTVMWYVLEVLSRGAHTFDDRKLLQDFDEIPSGDHKNKLVNSYDLFLKEVRGRVTSN